MQKPLFLILFYLMTDVVEGYSRRVLFSNGFSQSYYDDTLGLIDGSRFRGVNSKLHRDVLGNSNNEDFADYENSGGVPKRRPSRRVVPILLISKFAPPKLRYESTNPNYIDFKRAPVTGGEPTLPLYRIIQYIERKFKKLESQINEKNEYYEDYDHIIDNHRKIVPVLLIGRRNSARDTEVKPESNNALIYLCTKGPCKICPHPPTDSKPVSVNTSCEIHRRNLTQKKPKGFSVAYYDDYSGRRLQHSNYEIYNPLAMAAKYVLTTQRPLSYSYYDDELLQSAAGIDALYDREIIDSFRTSNSIAEDYVPGGIKTISPFFVKGPGEKASATFENLRRDLPRGYIQALLTRKGPNSLLMPNHKNRFPTRKRRIPRSSNNEMVHNIGAEIHVATTQSSLSYPYYDHQQENYDEYYGLNELSLKTKSDKLDNFTANLFSLPQYDDTMTNIEYRDEILEKKPTILIPQESVNEIVKPTENVAELQNQYNQIDVGWKAIEVPQGIFEQNDGTPRIYPSVASAISPVDLLAGDGRRSGAGPYHFIIPAPKPQIVRTVRWRKERH